MKSPADQTGEWKLLEKTHPKVPRETWESMARYVDLIFAWNQKINLTGAKSPQEFIEQQVGDCVAAWFAIGKIFPFVDVGTGAGLPGVIWAMLGPEFPCLLLDSSQKRSAFLQRVKAELKIPQAQILTRRFEDIVPTDLSVIDSGWDFVSRGTATPGDLLHLALNSSLEWKRWWVFSNEKIHHEYLTAAPPLGVEVDSVFYPRFSSTAGERPGILTLLQRSLNKK